jgi:hypothetical protein
VAKKGDLIVVNSRRVGGPAREGEIIEVIEGDLRVHFRVRWNDGHESLFAPGAGAARIEPARDRKIRSEGTEPKKSPAKASTARKSTAKTPTTKKSTAKKSTAKTARKSTAKKSIVRKVSAKKATSRGPSGRR